MCTHPCLHWSRRDEEAKVWAAEVGGGGADRSVITKAFFADIRKWVVGWVNERVCRVGGWVGG